MHWNELILLFISTFTYILKGEERGTIQYFGCVHKCMSVLFYVLSCQVEKKE